MASNFGRPVTETNPVSSGGGAVTVADGADATQGAQADAAATTDTGAFSVVALLKRGLQKLTSLLTALPASLGQTTMSASLPVVLASNQSAVSVSLTTRLDSTNDAVTNNAGPANVTTAVLQNSATATGNGTSFSVAGMGTVVFTTSGTFVGTVTFEGTTDNTGASGWAALTCLTYGTQDAVTTSTAPASYYADVTGLQLVRVRISAYTSGNITATAWALPLPPPGPRPAFPLTQVVTGSGQNTNDTPIPSTDVSAFRSVSVQTSVSFSGSLIFEASNDGVSFFSILAGLSTYTGSFPPQSTWTSPGATLFVCALQARYFRVRVSGGGASSVTCTAFFSSNPVNHLIQPTTLPAAAALADASSNPTTVAVGADLQTYNGSTWDRWHAPTKLGDVNAVSVGAIATVYTPTSGKKFRLLGGEISVSSASSVLFEDNSGGNTVFRTPQLLANTPYRFNLGPRGFLSAASNNVLKGTSSAAANLTGTLYFTEE